MELLLDRKYRKETYSIGNLYVDGVFFSNTLEDTDRNLFQGMQEDWIKKKKFTVKPLFHLGVTK